MRTKKKFLKKNDIKCIQFYDCEILQYDFTFNNVPYLIIRNDSLDTKNFCSNEFFENNKNSFEVLILENINKLSDEYIKN